jgi:hypothetical protein
MRQLCFRSLSQILSNDQNPNFEPIASWVPTGPSSIGVHIQEVFIEMLWVFIEML